MVENAELVGLAQFEMEASEWLDLDAFDGSHSGAFGSSCLIGPFNFEQAPFDHVEPNLVKSCAIVV